jgi:hypothetical protein
MAEKNRVCKHCGAPLLSEVCQYCGCRADGADTAVLPAEYETIDCSNASLTFWNTIFAGIFSVMFGIVGCMPLWVEDITTGSESMPRLFFVPFALVGAGATVVVVYSLYKYVLVSLKGKEITGTVYGYMDDVVSYNHRPGQVCKILVDTLKGKRFIYYSLQGTNRPYPVNGKVRLMVYKNYFRIIKEPKKEENLF